MVNDRFARRLWISAGIIVASLVIAFFALNYFSGDLAAQANTIVAVRATIQAQTDAVSNLAALEQQAPQAAQYQAGINALIPDQYALVGFSSWFTQEAKKYNVTASASFQGDMVQPTGAAPGTAQFTFDAEGSLSDLTTFLDAVSAKSKGFLVSFTTFDLSADGTNEKITGQGTLFFQ
jgi:hypothetical protein